MCFRISFTGLEPSKNVNVPAEALSTPVTIPSMVVFPLPLGPSIPKTAPSGTVNETSAKAVTAL